MDEIGSCFAYVRIASGARVEPSDMIGDSAMIMAPGTIKVGTCASLTTKDWRYGRDGGVFAFAARMPDLGAAKEAVAAARDRLIAASVTESRREYLWGPICARVLGSARPDSTLEVARDVFDALVGDRASSPPLASQLVERDPEGVWTYTVPLDVAFQEAPAPDEAPRTLTEARDAEVAEYVPTGVPETDDPAGYVDEMLGDDFGLDDVGIAAAKTGVDGLFKWAAIAKAASIKTSFKTLKASRKFKRGVDAELAEKTAGCGGREVALDPRLALAVLVMFGKRRERSE